MKLIQLRKIEIEVDILGGDKKAKFTNELLHYSDMFDSGKQFVTYEKLLVS